MAHAQHAQLPVAAGRGAKAVRLPRICTILNAKKARSAAFVTVCLLAGLAFAQNSESPAASAAPSLQAKWTKSYPRLRPDSTLGNLTSIALSDNARCLGLAGGGEVDVLSSSGDVLWRWNYRTINRFVVAGPLAVSASCNAFALAGDSGYKNVWIVQRRGKAIPIHFSATPLGVTFDRRGQTVAVGTGGGSVHLFRLDGKLVWKGQCGPVCFAAQLSFSKDNRYLLVHGWGTAVLNIDGSPALDIGGDGMDASPDLRTFVIWNDPHHGPGFGSVAAFDRSGKELWRKYSLGGSGLVFPSGDKILARLFIDQSRPEEEVPDPRDTDIQILARDGTVLKSFEKLDGSPLAISPDEKRMLIDATSELDGIDADGQKLFVIPTPGTTYLVAEDFSGVLVLNRRSDPQLSWYALK